MGVVFSKSSTALIVFFIICQPKFITNIIIEESVD